MAREAESEGAEETRRRDARRLSNFRQDSPWPKRNGSSPGHEGRVLRRIRNGDGTASAKRVRVLMEPTKTMGRRISVARCCPRARSNAAPRDRGILSNFVHPGQLWRRIKTRGRKNVAEGRRAGFACSVIKSLKTISVAGDKGPSRGEGPRCGVARRWLEKKVEKGRRREGGRESEFRDCHGDRSVLLRSVFVLPVASRGEFLVPPEKLHGA